MTMSCRAHVDADALIRMLGWSSRKRLVSTEDLQMFAQVTGLPRKQAFKLLKQHKGDKVAALKMFVARPLAADSKSRSRTPPSPAHSVPLDVFNSVDDVSADVGNSSSSDVSSGGENGKRVRFIL